MKVQVDGLPEGQYTVEFVGAAETAPPEEHPDWAPSVELAVMVVGGRFDGNIVTDRMGKNLSNKSRFGKVLRGIIGRELAPGENLDVSKYYGRRYHLLVEHVDGKTRFLSVVAVAE